MEAFFNDERIKEKLLNQLQSHYDSDEIIKGVYWKNGKGCAIGCAIHSNDHSLYEKLYNLPIWIAKVQDVIFEGLSNDKAKEWPLLFTKSVNVGSDLNQIKIPFLIFVAESTLDKFDHEKFPAVKKSIEKILSLLKNDYINYTTAAADAYVAAADAYAAADAAYAAAAADADADAYAAADAAYAASASASYAAASASADVAYASAYYAAAAAYVAASAADAAYASAYYDSAYADFAAYAADAAYAVSYIDSDYASAISARYSEYSKFADKLIELIKGT